MEEASPLKYVAIDLGASGGRAMLGRLGDGRLELEEIHRFANNPVSAGTAGATGAAGSLRWDVVSLETEIRRGIDLARADADELAGIGIDSWGVDYVLLDSAGRPVEAPYHYRDLRTEGAMAKVLSRVSRAEIFRRTGIQFLGFNTIYQLAAHDPRALAKAAGLLLLADYFSHRLGGGSRAVGEITLASTTQLLDASTQAWDFDLLGQLDLPAELLPELVEAGAITGEFKGIPIIATAAHDTAAAVAGCPAAPGEPWAFLSCGTWMILGAELPEPVLTDEALAAGLSNEAGVFGTTRLLRNITGLWLLQECRRDWAVAGKEPDWDELVASAKSAKPLLAVIDPDDPSLAAPGLMSDKIVQFIKRTSQPVPDSIAQMVRIILEALALKARWCLQRLESAAGRQFSVIHLVGGGVNNRLLGQLVADCTGRRVLAGPGEATAAGNVLVQAIGTGDIDSLPAGRAILRRSINLVEYLPKPSGAWDEAYAKLSGMLER